MHREIAVRVTAIVLLAVTLLEWISYDLDRAVRTTSDEGAQEGGSFLVEGTLSGFGTSGLALVPLGAFVIAALAAPASRTTPVLGVLALAAVAVRFFALPPDLGFGSEVVVLEPAFYTGLALIAACTATSAVAVSRRA